MKIKNIKWLEEEEDVYCCNVPETHNFCLENGVVVHNCDLADSGEAGICMCHKERRKRDNKTIIVIDFLIRIISPDRISLDSVQSFVVDLKKTLSLNLDTITADQYQSTAMLQYLEKHRIGKIVKRISVDRNLEPYNVFNSVVSEKLLKIGLMNELKTQLNNIYFSNGKPFARIGRKDLVDAIVGSVFNCVMETSDSPIYFYENDSQSDKEDFKKYVDENFITI